jgi:hypothetical protein
MTWWLIGALAWVALAVPAALLIGRSIREAEARREADVEAQLRAQAQAQAQSETPEGNFIASEEPPSEAPPTPWTGPQTVPMPPPGSVPRHRRSFVRNPLSGSERHPSPRDTGVR